MYLQWRVARKRQWIEYGMREGLTNKALAEEVGVNERTIRRWCDAFRAEEVARALSVTSVLGAEPAPTVDSPAADFADPPAAPLDLPAIEDQEHSESVPAFAEVVEASGPPGPQVQIYLEGGGRIVISGALEPSLLSRLIEAVHSC